MLAVRIGLAGLLGERSHEDDPLGDVVLAISAATGAILALLDGTAGALPLTAAPSLLIVIGHLAHRRRIGIAAAAIVWLRVFATGGHGVLTALLMLALCMLLLVGPGRVLDWAEERWAARAERLRHAREAAELADADHAAGWIEDLPAPR